MEGSWEVLGRLVEGSWTVRGRLRARPPTRLEKDLHGGGVAVGGGEHQRGAAGALMLRVDLRIYI